jgi:hypothetical protein
MIGGLTPIQDSSQWLLRILKTRFPLTLPNREGTIRRAINMGQEFLVLADMNIHRLPLTTINLIREALEQSPMVELIPNKEVVSLMVVEVKFVTKQF